MKKAIIAGLYAVIVAAFIILGMKFVGGRSTKKYLRLNATTWRTDVSRDGRFQIVIFKYPTLKDVPESMGFGQGFVQLQEVSSGKVLAEKDAQELSPLNSLRWSSNKVDIFGFAEWDLPQQP